jgi:hypothetical protein
MQPELEANNLNPQTGVLIHPAGSAICCQKCGERIRNTPYRWGSYEWLCGLCLDDLLNEDKKTSAQSPNSD